MAAVVSNYAAKSAASKYEASRGAELENSYQAQLGAAKAGYTKSGNISNSKAAQEARAAAEAAQPKPGSKAPWNKATEEKLMSQYNAKVGKLNKTVEQGLEKLKKTKLQGQENMYAQFGDYKNLAPKLLNSMSSEDRWKMKAEQRIMQNDAFNNFLNSLDK